MFQGYPNEAFNRAAISLIECGASQLNNGKYDLVIMYISFEPQLRVEPQRPGR